MSVSKTWNVTITNGVQVPSTSNLTLNVLSTVYAGVDSKGSDNRVITLRVTGTSSHQSQNSSMITFVQPTGVVSQYTTAVSSLSTNLQQNTQILQTLQSSSPNSRSAFGDWKGILIGVAVAALILISLLIFILKRRAVPPPPPPQ